MKRIVSKFYKIAAWLLVLTLIAAMMPLPVAAAQENTSKEEVVYVNLNADGTVSDVHVVNIFDMAETGTIVDYGSYDQLRNMTSTNPISYDQGLVTIETEAGKLYYEGRLSEPVLPWNIAIRYFIDGKEYSAEKVAGMSGALRIEMDITRNSRSDTNFFDSFALQVSLVLDTAKCANIVAEGATIANVGNNKQLTHTILPGTGAQLEIMADVVDFSMEGISINAIPLNLNIEVDDEALLGKVTELQDAIEELDSGAASLNEGASTLLKEVKNGLAGGAESLNKGAKNLESGAGELRTGGKTLQSGAQKLKDGTTALNEGMKTLNSGIIRVQSALNTLNGNSASLTDGSEEFLSSLQLLQRLVNEATVTNQDLSELTAASEQILDSLVQLADSANALQHNVGFSALKATMAENGLDVDSLRSGNDSAISSLQAMAEANPELTEELEQIIQQLQANNSFIDGTGSYLESANGSVAALADHVAVICDNYAAFDETITELADKLDSLADDMSMLTTAINTLVSEYQKLDNGISSYTGAVAEIVAGYSEIVSGSSKLTTSCKELVSGAATLHTGTGNLLKGIEAVYKGAGSLREGSNQLVSGVTELLQGITELYDGTSRLESGTSTIHEETSDMDTAISEQVDSMLSGITGENFETGSFVSEQNTNVESVQFVIKTPAIENTEVAQSVSGEEEALTFWQKLLKLFDF